jgi:hypothetical protein
MVMSLKYNDDFLMHGVVLHFSCFRAQPASRTMFHVKHLCVKGLRSQAAQRRAMFHVKPFSPAPLTTRPRRVVSRETFLRKDARFFLSRH